MWWFSIAKEFSCMRVSSLISHSSEENTKPPPVLTGRASRWRTDLLACRVLLQGGRAPSAAKSLSSQPVHLAAESPFHRLVVCLSLSSSLSSWEFGLSKEEAMSQSPRSWKRAPPESSLPAAFSSARHDHGLSAVWKKTPPAGMFVQS